MRIRSMIEVVLAFGVGLALAKYRLTWPDRAENFGLLTAFHAFEVGIDALFAGIGLVGGLGTFVERVRGRSPMPWGPGRWVWFLFASYLFLTLLDSILGTIALRFNPEVVFIQNSISTDIIYGLRGGYGDFLLGTMTLFLSVLGLTTLAARRQPGPVPDAREWGGRAFAVMLVATGLVLRVLLLLDIHQGYMGGGMQ